MERTRKIEEQQRHAREKEQYGRRYNKMEVFGNILWIVLIGASLIYSATGVRCLSDNYLV